MLLNYADLYGFSVLLEHLKKEGFTSVSYRKKTIPSEVTQRYPIEALKPDLAPEVYSAVQHVGGTSVTLKTSVGNLRFWKRKQ